MTQPDMHLTVQELLENHTRGIQSAVKVYEQNYFDTEIPQFDDIIEKENYIEQLNVKKEQVEQEIQNEKAQKAEKDAKTKAEQIKKLKDELKSEQTPQ